MTKIKGAQGERKIVKPIGRKKHIFVLEEKLQVVELDSPSPGLETERAYANFLYILLSREKAENKMKRIQETRIRQGWERDGPTTLRLDFGDKQAFNGVNGYHGHYELDYKINEQEVFS